MISSIFTSIQKNIFKSSLYNSIIEQSIKKSALKKNIVNLLLLFSTELHVDTFKLFKCLKNILKTFIHFKTYDAFICKVSLFHLPLIRLKNDITKNLQKDGKYSKLAQQMIRNMPLLFNLLSSNKKIQIEKF